MTESQLIQEHERNVEMAQKLKAEIMPNQVTFSVSYGNRVLSFNKVSEVTSFLHGIGVGSGQ